MLVYRLIVIAWGNEPEREYGFALNNDRKRWKIYGEDLQMRIFKKEHKKKDSENKWDRGIEKNVEIFLLYAERAFTKEINHYEAKA